jgi:hypothetical protein
LRIALLRGLEERGDVRHESNPNHWVPTREGIADSPWNWLTLGQHHGQPTRLLGWTFSPYVALHFAPSHLDRFGSDGVVWCVDFIKARRFLPEALRAALETEGANVFTAEMLGKVAPGLREFDRLGRGPFAFREAASP